MAQAKGIRFLWKKTCSTCRTARSFLKDEGVKVDEERDLGQDPLSVAELEALLAVGEPRDYKVFLNFRNELYRERKMKQNPPARAEALKLMSENPNLIRRPILIVEDQLVLGFQADAWKELLER